MTNVVLDRKRLEEHAQRTAKRAAHTHFNERYLDGDNQSTMPISKEELADLLAFTFVVAVECSMLFFKPSPGTIDP